MSHRGEGLKDDLIFQKEFDKSNINTEELTYYLHDGKENYDRLVELSKLYTLDPEVRFQYHEFDDTREEQFKANYRKLTRLRQLTKEKGLPLIDYTNSEEYGPPMNTLMNTSLHHKMFETSLRILGSEEQVKELLPKVLSYEILG